MKLKEYLSAHKGKIVRIGCYTAGAIVMCVVLGKAFRPQYKGYIVTDLVVSDLGKLGDELIKHGCGANDKVLRWKMDFEKM